MNVTPQNDPLRKTIFILFIAITAAMVAGRILAVVRVYEPYLFRKPGDTTSSRPEWPAVRPEPMATLQANDRSRWCTIRALVDEGTYVIGHRDSKQANNKNPNGDYGIHKEDGWETIDKVLKPGLEPQEFYSSKPPLLSTILAGEYMVLKQVFGWQITDLRGNGLVVRTILFTVNWLPWLISLMLLSRLIDRIGTTDWGKMFVMAAACFASFQTTFGTTLNNHTVATWSAVFALYYGLEAIRDRQKIDGENSGSARWNLGLAGFFACFTACNELPAAAFGLVLFLVLFFHFPRFALFYFLAGAIAPAGAFLGTNFLAIGKWTPAYSEIESPWYQYAGSHWKINLGGVKPGIDFAWQKENRVEYFINFLVGHHGLFSLSPIFLLTLGSIIVVLAWYRFRSGTSGSQGISQKPGLLVRLRSVPEVVLISGFSLVLMVSTVGFYMIKSNNYGGWTSGPRWLMWLTPFFLLAMLPGVDWLGQKRWGRGLAYILLGFSVISVSYPAWNPWRHPWIYNLLEALDRIKY